MYGEIKGTELPSHLGGAMADRRKYKSQEGVVSAAPVITGSVSELAAVVKTS